MAGIGGDPKDAPDIGRHGHQDSSLIYGCTKCDHEWLVIKGHEKHRLNCGWCGAPGKELGPAHFHKNKEIADALTNHCWFCNTPLEPAGYCSWCSKRDLEKNKRYMEERTKFNGYVYKNGRYEPV